MKFKGITNAVLGAALMICSLISVNAVGEEDLAACKTFGFCDYNGKKYWYENGTRQGVYGDKKNIWDTEYGLERGREIYDPETDAWYWLDAVYDGAAAYGKEVWMPYVYQDEKSWSDEQKAEVAENSNTGMEDFVLKTMKDGTGKWVRYDENGKMLKGWVKIEGELGRLYPGQAGNQYYYDPCTGLMAKGKLTIDGEEYHFDETTGALLENPEENRVPSQIEDEIYTPNPEHIAIDPETGIIYVNNMIIVVFEPGSADDDILSLIQKLNGRVVGKLDVIDQYQIEIPGRSLADLTRLIEEIEQYDSVMFAHYDMLSEMDVEAWAPNDPWNGDVDEEDWQDSDVDGSNWWLEAMEVPAAWDYRDQMSSIKIGVVDAGFDTGHPDFAISFPDDYERLNRADDHGTHVAGIIGARADNDSGITGICPNAELIGFDWKPTDWQNFVQWLPWNKDWDTTTMIVSGCIKCIENGAKVINLSAGQSGRNYEERNVLSASERRSQGRTMSGYIASLLIRGFDFIAVQSAGNEKLTQLIMASLPVLLVIIVILMTE